MRPSFSQDRTRFEYTSRTIRVPEGLGPNIKNKSFTLTADIDVPETGANGVLATEGGRFGGWSLYLKDGSPVFTYNYFSQQVTNIADPEKLPAGPAEIKFVFAYDGGGIGKGGDGTLFINGKQVAESRIARTPSRCGSARTRRLTWARIRGRRRGDYECPFAFNRHAEVGRPRHCAAAVEHLRASIRGESESEALGQAIE